ncbi:hypothetical protein [Flavihumibacter profundi]|uniref:hypothetical protein n=1 Tax=Flavihumibacter profundi TaxID=2716883 RepID=UPI001CC4001A|nr:hypothetical protein [Flavihumibacter profundi]MBZ5857794.1 hypothetical protein [Flavihumibacter profundi]
MAINKNHEFEDLEGVKCAIVERKASAERLAFLKPLLEANNFTVIAVPTEDTFTIGVTDVMFNPVNAIFGRLLKTESGQVVSLAYWKQQQQEPVDGEPIPYFARNASCD